MTIRLYLDEDTMDRDLVQALRARNVDVVTALDAGMVERADAEHLDYASEQGRVLCSFNAKDFYRLHSEYLTHRPSARRTQCAISNQQSAMAEILYKELSYQIVGAAMEVQRTTAS